MQDAKERSDGQALTQIDPWLELVPGPTIHPDLAAFAAFAVPHKNRPAPGIEICFREGERFADSQAGTPQNDDQGPEPDAVGIVSGCPHDRDDLLDRGRIGRVSQAFVTWRAALVEARERGWRPTPASTVER